MSHGEGAGTAFGVGLLGAGVNFGVGVGPGTPLSGGALGAGSAFGETGGVGTFFGGRRVEDGLLEQGAREELRVVGHWGRGDHHPAPIGVMAIFSLWTTRSP